ncbi:site-specific DNA-methyltransferase [Desulfarculus baarsii]
MARLTDQEKQDIIRHLEADKPLPDKYRFLLFEDKREVELVWNGKTGEVCNIVLPFQTIEHVDEPRAENKAGQSLDLFDTRGRQLKGWTNKLIWGDNKLILSSLKNGPLRERIEAQGGLKLIYIDPPFDVGADFSMDIEIGGDTFTKKPNILEEIAYRDTWGKGADSFIAMIYERLVLMRDLLADDGSIYVHCDWRVAGHIRYILDETFGINLFRNELIWKRQSAKSGSFDGIGQYGRIHETIYYYTKCDSYIWNQQYTEYDESYISNFYKYTEAETGRRYRLSDLTGAGIRQGDSGGAVIINGESVRPATGRHWALGLLPGESVQDAMNRLLTESRVIFKSGGMPQYKRYLDEMSGVSLQDVWIDIQSVAPKGAERLDYPTQKPEALLERIIKASSNEGDLVADFFCGSGTTAAVAEKLGRKWIATDLGKFAIHTTRKRMIGVQRQLKADGKPYRAFEVLNLGKYERQHFIGVNLNLREEERQKQLEEKEAAFLELILRAYRAEKVEGFQTFHGKKAGRMVVVGPVNLPVTRVFVEEVILECRKMRVSWVDVLGFEFEMGLFPNVLDDARGKGIDIAPKYIPAEVFDKRAVEKNQVVFHDVAYLEVKPLFKGDSVAMELTNYSVFYSQDSDGKVEANLKEKSSKVVVQHGQIVKISRDKDGIVTREVLTKTWTDWIDYWSVDFDFESKREIVVDIDPATGEPRETWTGDYIFENEWQSFRTKKDRSLELVSAYQQCAPGRRKIAVKVVDIFGNDTMSIVEVTIGGSR